MINLTPSHLIQHSYCPRFTYFEHVLKIPQNEEKYGKVMRGRQIHEQKLVRNKRYLRRRLGVTGRHDNQHLYMAGMRGIIDEVLFLNDGTCAPLDYKFTKAKEKMNRTYRLQLTCYALLVEANFDRPVHRGFLVYVRSKHQVQTLPITKKERDNVRRLSEEVRSVITQNTFPKATKYKKQCLSCTYRNVCVQ